MGKRALQNIISAYRPGLIPMLLSEILIMSCFLCFDVISPYLYKLLVDRVLIRLEINKLLPLCLLMLLVFAARSALNFFQKKVEIKYEYNLQDKLKKQLLSCFINTKRHEGNGELLNIYDKYTEIFSGAVKKYLVECLFNLITLLVMSLIVCYINWMLFLFSTLAIILSFVINHICSIKIEKNTRNYRKTANQYESWQISVIQNFTGIKGLNRQDALEKKCLEKEKNLFFLMRKERKIVCVMEIMQDFNFRFIMEMNLYFVGGILILQGQLTLGTFLAFFSYFRKLYSNLRQLGRKEAALSKDKIIIDKIIKLINEPSNQLAILEQGYSMLHLHNIFYRYDNSAFSLYVKELHIARGEKIALAGKSGSGKSTLARLLTKEKNDYQGSIIFEFPDTFINDKNTSLKCIHAEKESCFFNLSVIDNLRLISPELTVTRVEELLFVCFTPEEITSAGLLTEQKMGENGCNLSGGQKERLNIIRIILASPDLIIWDEATSQINISLENEIYSRLENLLKNSIQIFIAHRKEILNYVQKVIYIENGNVKEVYSTSDFLGSLEYKKLFIQQ